MVDPYYYIRFRWWKGIDLNTVLKDLGGSFKIEMIILPSSDYELIQRKDERDELKVDADRCGLHGSPTKVHKVDSVVLAGGEHIKIEPTKKGMNQLIDKLMDDRIFG